MADKEKRGGLVARWLIGKERSEDYARSTLPTSRWALFWDILKGRFGKLVLVNLFMVVTFLPVAAVIVLRVLDIGANGAVGPYAGGLGVGYPVLPDLVGYAENIVFYSDLVWFGLLIPAAAIAALGIAGGCKLISQHADSMGAPSACEEAGVPNVSYNGSTFEACPETFLVSSYIDWTPYFKYIIAKAAMGEEIADDWTGTIKTGSVKLTNIGGNAAAEGTVDKVIEIRDKLVDGSLAMFDTSKFTVGGETLTSYMVDIDGDGTKEKEAVKDGVFQESLFRAAPYFDVKIDGITLLNEKV